MRRRNKKTHWDGEVSPCKIRKDLERQSDIQSNKCKTGQRLGFPNGHVWFRNMFRTINAACRRRIEAFEMICYRKMMCIPWTAHRTNASILSELNIQGRNRLLSTIQRCILIFFGHVIRRDGMERLCIQGKVDGRRRRGRSPNKYIDQVKTLANRSMADVMRSADDREEWRTLVTQ